MRLPFLIKVLLAAVLFVILGVLWSWAAAGVLSVAALFLLGSAGTGTGTGRRTDLRSSDGAPAAFMFGDSGGCDPGGGFDGGGGCDGG